MRIRMPANIRDRRIKLGLDQPSHAQKVGISRKWIIEVEKGIPRAEFGLLLRTIDVLGSILATENEASRKDKRRDPLRSILILSSLPPAKK
jgi:DNA-binding XRE family transcriptional regulator